MSSLVIVESPTKAKTLSRFLGTDYDIQASMGHVRDLPKKTLGVDVEHDFTPEYVVVEGREKTIKELKSKAKMADKVILATDPDREGEAIAYHIAHLLGENSKLQRIVFHEITEHAIKEAIAHPGTINQHLVDAQQGRRVLDRLVGYKLSPLLWRKVRRGLSAGRVQSVTVRLIVEREREIEAFQPQEYWQIEVEVRKGSTEGTGSMEGSKFVVALLKIGEEKAAITNKTQADEVVADLENAGYTVADVIKKEVKKHPYPPFMTSTLQRNAAVRLRWSSRKTMRAAQGLYEAGLITYHRTDSLSIASQALTQAASFIKEKYGVEYVPPKPRVFRSKSKLAQEAHEAIRPTDIYRVSAEGHEGANQDGIRLYQLIWQRFVASQMAEALYDATRIDVEARNKKQETRNNDYLLRATGEVMKFAGWKAVYGKSKESTGSMESIEGGTPSFAKATDGQSQILPEVEKEEKLTKEKVMANQKFTEPPARYNEASLIKALEEKGIGRPSTYAPIITTIQTRQYVEKKESRFWPTAIGVAVTDFLLKYFPKIMDYDFTAGMEGDLDTIATGNKAWAQTIKEFYDPFATDVEKVQETAERVKVKTEETGNACPTCGEGREVIRVGRFGKFLSCSLFPKCRYTAPYVEKIEGVKCPEDGGDIVVRKTKRGKRFYGCSHYPKCKWASWRQPRRS